VSNPKPIYPFARIHARRDGPGQASRTAFGAATYRAAHQIIDHDNIFRDPCAFAVLGERADAAIQESIAVSLNQVMRMFIAARSRSRRIGCLPQLQAAYVKLSFRVLASHILASQPTF
jgi:hypothetical protein